MDRTQLNKTRKILTGVLMIADATNQPSQRVLNRVLREVATVPRKGPTPAASMRAPLEFKRASA